MNSAQPEARHQQQVEELCAAAIRALSGDPDLHFRGRRLHRGRQPLPIHAPHLRPSLTSDDFASFRGAADGMALRLAHSEEDLHRRLSPTEPVQRLVFEMLEQFRVESLAPAEMPGVVSNLRHRHEQWSLAFRHAGLTETPSGILIYTVAQISRSRVTGEPVVHETEDLLEATRFALAPSLGNDLAGLRRHKHDQATYARHALVIARLVAGMVETVIDDEQATDHSAGADDLDGLELLVDLDGDSSEHLPTAASGRSEVLERAGQGYRVFTTAYDRQSSTADLVRPALLREYRERLDRRNAGQCVNIPRLAHELRALLADPTVDGWEHGQELGYIDGSRLSQLVTSPGERRLFRTPQTQPVASCLVTFLVDCSGSMKEHGESVAVIIDVFARALELAGVTSEILGFTTGAWNGGRAMRDWKRQGRPAHPGRLNEVQHLVFKDAETSWRRSRPDIAALLKADLFREGVDGEAVAWACQRMHGRAERRRLLIVVSDGSPMDGATTLTNDPHYLDSHLRDVVAREELAGRVRIHGLGVGLDLSPYYSRSHALDLSAGTTNQMFREILGLIAGRGSR